MCILRYKSTNHLISILYVWQVQTGVDLVPGGLQGVLEAPAALQQGAGERGPAAQLPSLQAPPPAEFACIADQHTLLSSLDKFEGAANDFLSWFQGSYNYLKRENSMVGQEPKQFYRPVEHAPLLARSLMPGRHGTLQDASRHALSSQQLCSICFARLCRLDVGCQMARLC